MFLFEQMLHICKENLAMSIIIKNIFLTSDLTNHNTKDICTDQSTDVIVQVENNDYQFKSTIEKYVATFFSYQDILNIKNKHYKTGEYLNGKYFFFKNMVLIDDCSKESISKVVNNLIEEGDFIEVFNRL